MNAVVLCLSLIVSGIALAIAGAIITILDGNQINRMNQFDDISDLISWI
jgi:VIT1/CCC1 family predicted Fe2+/Mn2+ transporter